MDILQFAIQMEKDGEKYYTEQAGKNKDNVLSSIFHMLAREEAKHASILQSFADGKPHDLVGHNIATEQKNLFENEADYQAKMGIVPEQSDLYAAAMEKEKQSIDLYSDLLTKAEDQFSRALFTFLVKEEQDHYDVMEDLYHHVNRPNGWVESAEFGIREDY